MNRTFVDIGGKRLPLSNLEKDLYPSSGFTKAAILDYYRGIGPFILPHLKDRAVTFKRYPKEWKRSPFLRSAVPLIVLDGSGPRRSYIVTRHR